MPIESVAGQRCWFRRRVRKGAHTNNLPVQDPNYTGICGGGFPPPQGAYPLTHVKGNPPDTVYAPGWASTGGILLLDVAITTSQVTDGLSNTMIVGEQSDWCLTSDGQNRDCRSDCGQSFFMGGAWVTRSSAISTRRASLTAWATNRSGRRA